MTNSQTKKVFIAVLASVGLFLAGCSSNSTGANSATATAAAPVVVKFNILGYSPNTPKLYQEAIDAFQAANPGIKVELTNGSWDTAYEKILGWVKSGDTPDITVLGPKWLPDLYALDALQPFDKYASAGLLANFSPALLDPLKKDGQQYSLPEALSTRMMLYRKDVYDKARITSAPKTWAEFKTALQKIKAVGGFDGLCVQGTGDETIWYYAYFMLGAGGDFVDSTGNWNVNQPANIEALKYEVDLVKSGLTNKNPAGVNQDSVQALFTSGKASTYWGPPWILPGIKAELQPNVMIANYPTKSGKPAPLYIQDSFVLFKAAKHPAEAVKFLEFWNQDKYQVKFNLTESLIPITTSSGAASEFQSNAALKAFIDAIPMSKSYPIKKGWETVNNEVRNAVQSALLGKASPKDALDLAQKTIASKVNG
jgi:ABC-type glycerol-3-phosphate transport system substrate-binding protein